MSALRYRCPTTNNDVTTAIETAPDTLSRMKVMNLKIWVWCPHCPGGHQIRAGEAMVQDQSLPSDTNLRRFKAA